MTAATLRPSNLLYAAGEHAAACDAASAPALLRPLAERRGEVPWAPLPRAVRDEMKRDGGGG